MAWSPNYLRRLMNALLNGIDSNEVDTDVAVGEKHRVLKSQ